MVGILKNVESTPEYNIYDQHLWVDYIELHCFLSNELSESDIRKLFSTDYDDLNLNQRLEADSQTERRDKAEVRYYDYISHIEMRVERFGEAYPFEFDDGLMTLKENLSEFNLAYLYLLGCSHLTYVTPEGRAVLTTDFELISVAIIKSFFNNKTEVHGFGKNISGSTRYQGNLSTKLRKLSEDISCHIEAEDTPSQSTGDGGIDIVGWYGPWDDLVGRILIFAQCKCSPDWMNNRDALSCAKDFLSINFGVNNFFLIPYAFRKIDGTWHQLQYARQNILIDRLRIFQDFPLQVFINCKSFNFFKKLIQ